MGKAYLSQLEKLLDLQDWRIKQFGRWLTRALSNAIKHLPDKEESIFKVFKSSVVCIFLIKKSSLFKKKILSTLGCRPKSKWTTFLDNLNSSSDQSSLTIELLQILLQESISKEKVCQPFWKPVYKDVSDKLLLPIGTDFVGLDLTLSNNWFPKQEVKSSSLTIQTIKHVSKNLQTTCWPSSMSSLAVKWEKEVMPIASLKTLKVKIYPTTKQKKLLDMFIDTSRFVYNRTLEYINKGHKINFKNLRDLLVTDNTKKGYDEYKQFDTQLESLRQRKKATDDLEVIASIDSEIKAINQQRRNMMKEYDYVKNPLVHEFETNTPKDIRACAVKRCCDAYKSGFANLRKGNIKFFRMGFKKKKERYQSIELTPKLMSLHQGKIQIAPDTFKGECFLKTSKKVKRKLERIEIVNNVDIVRSNYGYYLHINVPTIQNKQKLNTVGGVDLGIRTFATVHTHNVQTNETTITEYKHRQELLKQLNKKIKLMKQLKRIREKQISKCEKRKIDIVNQLHWDFVNDLLSQNDVVYLGDIKSHDIVKNGKNKYLNQAFNDLKFFTLKQRLFYKAGLTGKKVILVPEHYTTKTCSSCGEINNDVGSKEIFECPCCKMKTGRDMNASKNMKMKGFFL